MYLVVLCCVILIDQITKYLAVVYLQPQSTVPVINNFFYLTYVENSGTIFNIIRCRAWLFIVLTVLICVVISYYVHRSIVLNGTAKVSIALIVAGALSNMIDRIRLGYLIDFFDFEAWPVFNVADICAFTGAVILIFLLLLNKQKRRYRWGR